MSHHGHLKNPKYRYWVKAGLGLKYVKEGLVGFVDDILKQQHNNILTTLNSTASNCNQCNLRTLLPSHAQSNKSKNNKCPLGLTKCNCLYSSKKLKNCPNNICDSIHDIIVLQHASNTPEPNWKNCGIKDWGQNHWEIGKCYIYAAGYATKKTGLEIDCSGLLHIIINNKEAHKHLSCNITGDGQDIFSKMRQARNDILHSGTMELEKSQVDDYIDDMITLLGDQKELAQRLDSIRAVTLLKTLKSEKFAISTKDEKEIIQEAISAIETKKIEVLDEIETKCGETKTELEGIAESLQDDIKKSNRAIDDVHRRIYVLENQLAELSKKQSEDADNLKKQLCGVREDIDRLAEMKTQHNERLAYLKRKEGLQSYLIKLYSEHYVNVSASPLMPSENDTDIIDLYVTPRMEICNDQQQKAPNQNTDVQSYKDIFERDGKRANNIYISGKAGIGKSAFCKNMIRKWCIAHSRVKDELDGDDSVTALEEFDFLFFVSLRHAGGRDHIHDMIINQLTDGNGSDIAEILENEDDKCLILLDGLDEWTPTKELCDLKPFENPNVPRRHYMKNYTVVTTTRPLKLASVDFRSSDIGHHVQILGLGQVSLRKITENTVAQLNKKFQRSKKADEFEIELRKTHLWKTEIPRIPIMIQQLICIWHDGKSILQSSYSEIFSCMLDLMFRWADLRGCRDRNLKSLKQESMDQINANAVREGINGFTLPQNLRFYDKCIEYQFMIYHFGKFAFDTLYSKEEEQLVFDRTCLRKAGILDSETMLALNVGILSEDRMKGNAAAASPNTTIAFIHKTFHEFFAACFVAICAQNTSYLQKEYGLFGAEKLKQSRETYSLISRLTSGFADMKAFLNNSSVILLLCGLYPPLCSVIYSSIYCGLKLDVKVAYSSFQDFVFKCIKECISNDSDFSKECITLQALNIDVKLQSSLLQYIDSTSVHLVRISLDAFQKFKLEQYIENIAKSGNLWALEISADFWPPRETTALRQVLVECRDSLVELTLRQLQLYWCAEIESILPDMAILRSLSLDFVSLSEKQMNSLKEFFTKSRHLLEIRLSNVRQCDIADYSRESICGYYPNAPGPVRIDLSNHSQLECVSLEQSEIIFNKLNTSYLKTYCLGMLGPEILTENIKSVSGAKSLRCLSIHNHITFGILYRIERGHKSLVWDTLQETIQTLPNLETLIISGYMDSALSFTPLGNLKTLRFFNVRLESNDIWFKSVESLFRMHQSVTVEVRACFEKADLIEFVEKNVLCHVTDIDDNSFDFKTLIRKM